MENLALRISDKSLSCNSEPWLKAGFERLAIRCGCGIASEIESDSFYHGTVRLIRQLATPFWKKNPNWYQMDDLIQLCYSRIWETLKLYNPDKAAISTWLYYVCMSVLCKEYNGAKIYKHRFFMPDDKEDEECSTKGLEKFASFNEDNLLKIRVRDAIVSLFEGNQEKSDILTQIFGNPLVENYEPPFGLPSMTDIARTLGPKYKYTEIYGFYKETVQPFFKTLFSDYNVSKEITQE